MRGTNYLTGNVSTAKIKYSRTENSLFAGTSEKIELIETVILDLKRTGHKAGTADQQTAFRLPAISQTSGAKPIIRLFE